MEIRNRSYSRSALYGEVYTFSHGFRESLGFRSVIFEQKTTMDFHKKTRRLDGSLPPSDFESDLVERVPICLNSSTGTFRFESYAVDGSGTTPNLEDAMYAPRGSGQRLAENAYYTQMLLAETNPLRHEFSIPIAIKELAEIAGLFKITAESMTQYIGGNYLNYKFGWKAFVADIKTLASITRSIESRVREFESLHRKGDLRRKLVLDTNNSGGSASNLLVQSTWGTQVRVQADARASIKFTGSVRWRYKDGLIPDSSLLKGFNKAVQTVLDLEELDGTTAWGLVPFSWLVDYFINISDFLQGSEGYVELEPYDICIMREWRCRISQKVTSKPASISVSGNGMFYRTIKARDVCFRGSFPTIRTGLLSSSQFLTIAALLARLRG